MVMRNLEFEMSGDRHFTRIDILDIKIQIGKKLGNQKSRKYFSLLNSFLGLELAKSEFDKLCVAEIGRENICLHNRLIRSNLKNAFQSKTPPPKGNNVKKPGTEKFANGYQRSCLQSLCRDVFTQSPKKGRTPGFRGQKGKDHLSPLGPHGKSNAAAGSEDLGQQSVEQQSSTELLSLGSRPVEVVTSVEDGEEVDQAAISPGIQSRSPITLTPPLGIPWNGKGNRKVLNSISTAITTESCHGNGFLPDTGSLRKRLEQKLEKEGMRVSVDCVNLLNNGLDTFLKTLIKPSLELANSRVEYKEQNQVNRQACATVLNFRTAVELDPEIFGEDWPIQLEKVCLREYESGD